VSSDVHIVMVGSGEGEVPVHAMQAYGGSGGTAMVSLNLGTRWRRVFSFMPRLLYPWHNSTGTHRIRCWVGFGAGMDILEREESLLLLLGIKPQFLSFPAPCVLVILSYPGLWAAVLV
jgi:hypothetical protein